MSSCLKYIRDQNPATLSFQMLTSLAHTPYLLPTHSSSSICFISCCALSRCWNAKHEKKKRWWNLKKEKKKHTTFFSFYPLCLPLNNPLSGFSSKSNLAHVSILTSIPSFTSCPHPASSSLSSSFSSPITFSLLPLLLFSIVPPHASVFPPSSSPLPLTAVPPSISR